MISPGIAHCLAACHNFGSRSVWNGRCGESAENNYPRKERYQIRRDQDEKFSGTFGAWYPLCPSRREIPLMKREGLRRTIIDTKH